MRRLSWLALVVGAFVAGDFDRGPAGDNYQRLKSFGSVTNDGRYPVAAVMDGSDGALYGTTKAGGTTTSGNTNNDGGTVFKLNKDGTGYTNLHNFYVTVWDGDRPLAGLVEGGDGALYGTTYTIGYYGAGTVFKLNKDGGGYTNLHFFGSVHDGAYPSAPLLKGSDGALYGTSYYGGSNSYGTAFKLSTNGNGYAKLHSFIGPAGYPNAGLVEGGDGLLYGSCVPAGWNAGTIYKMQKDGNGYTNLHTFGGSDGSFPATLLEGSDGVLYGTTSVGGIPYNPNKNGNGVVFKLNKDGSGFGVLHNFNDNSGDGQNPLASLVEGNDGALYGTTEYGGTNRDANNYTCGVIFRLIKDGSGYSVLYNFGTSGSDGKFPAAPLVKGSDGAFYGTTERGGDFGCGTVFRLVPPGRPIMKAVTVAGDTVSVLFWGTSGYNYQLLRSTNLTSWIVLSTITMPTNGLYTNTDTTSSGGQAYYRAAWFP